MVDIKEEFKRWKENATEDVDLVNELNEMEKDSAKKEDAFYRDLEFGTGGLRGVLGAGTNRMNIYTVRKASQGLANYILKHFKNNKTIAISYDSRIKSDLFAKASAEVFAANGIKSYIYKELMPTPCVSFAVRELKCAAGIMVTASHNPSKYNGYKVYSDDGCQITVLAAEEILNNINSLDVFEDVKHMDFEEALKKGLVEYIKDEVVTKFIERVKQESLLNGMSINKDVKIIYSPLHGTGLKPVTRILKESGYNNVIVVKEQELPDGNFTTCPYPNPEIKEAMQVGIEYAKRENADLLIATDPDCDRVGIAVKDKSGEHVLLTGNQVGVLLLDYICSMRMMNNTMPNNPICVKTIVTTDMVKAVADSYGVQTIEVLTGFKYIGEQIGLLEKKHEEDRYILGFEESYGYLTGSYVRDKDAVDGVFMIVEMFAYYMTQGISLIDKLDELYKKFGCYSNYLKSYEFEGSKGLKKMQTIMERFRKLKVCGFNKVTSIVDYQKGVDGLPISNVLKIALDDGTTFIVRPSGTEPKLKIYISVVSETFSINEAKSKAVFTALEEIVK